MHLIYIIADIAQAHDGSLGILHSYIDAVSKTGINAIKFQTHIADAESSKYEPFRVNFSFVDKTRYDYWKRMELSQEQWAEIKKHCDDSGVDFISTPFSCAAVDILEAINAQKYKIGSGEVTNLLLLDKIARTGKEIILSSGMSDFSELDTAVQYIRRYGNKLTILQCTTRYPTPAENTGLNVIPLLRERYGLPVGFSDHSGEIYPAIAAAVLGAVVIEVHAVFDKSMFGPDASSSLTITQLKEMTDGVRYIERALANPTDKSRNEQYNGLKKIFEKSLAVNKNIPVNYLLRLDDLEAKKPAGYGIPAQDFERVIGKRLKHSKTKWDFLEEKDIE